MAKSSSRGLVVGIVVVMAVVAVLQLVLRERMRCAGFEGPGVTAEELPPAADPAGLRVAQLNVRNYPLDERPQTADLPYARRTNICDLEAVMAGLDADVLGLAEIRDTRRFVPVLQRSSNEREYRALFAGNGGSLGQHVGIAWDDLRLDLVAEPVEIRAVAVERGLRSGFAVRLRRRDADRVDFTVVQVHLASAPRNLGTRRRQVDELAAWVDGWIERTGDADVVVMGDFNTSGGPGVPAGVELAGFDRTLAAVGLRRLPNATGCSQYWEGSRRDGVLEPSLLDHVWVGGLPGIAAETEVEAWLHCRRAGCGPLISRPGDEDGTFWDVSDHCPLTFAMPPA